MELYQIQCIKKIAEYQNMSQAALALNTSQPSLSRTLRNIESELELTLFDRIGKKLVLNENGVKFCQYADKILDFYDHMLAELKPPKTKVPESLNIAMLHSTKLLPGLIADFSTQHPEIMLLLQHFTSLSEVSDNCDFMLHASTHMQPTGYRSYRLFEEECEIGMSAANPLAQKAEITEADLATQKFIILSPGNSLTEMIQDYFSLSGINPDITLQCDSQFTAASLIAQNMGVTIFPTLTWDTSSVVLKRIRGTHLTRTIYLSQKSASQSKAAIMFKDFILQVITNYFHDHPSV